MTFHRSILGLLAMCASISLTAQEPVEEKKGGFGFNMGLVYGQAILKTDLGEDPNIRIWVQNQGGVSTGVLYQHKLDHRVSVKGQLNLTWLESFVAYETNDGVSIRKEIFPAFAEIPIHLHFTNRAENNNISALFGLKISKSLDPGLDQEFILRDSFTSAEFGLGKEFDFKQFTIAPEVTYSFGLENLYRYSILPEFAENVEQLVLNQLAIRILFY
ncbi:MAG: hypothetical protein HKN32_06925 [Flavobacteriales bacterium]|nr:hypothetical protein [Flavobacteriales bacterium]